MRYLVPFVVLKKSLKLVSVRGQVRVDLGYEDFLALVKKLLLGVDVDEAWYRKAYPDVDLAVQSGLYADAKAHFVAEGYLEGRRPFPLEMDEEFYLRDNPDVREKVDAGEVVSVRDHFDKHGYEEGRLPGNLEM